MRAFANAWPDPQFVQQPAAQIPWTLTFRKVGLVCSRCGGEVEIIAFITEEPTVRAILTHLGEPHRPPPVSPCRGPPTRDMFDQAVEFDPIHPEPENEFDQPVRW